MNCAQMKEYDSLDDLDDCERDARDAMDRVEEIVAALETGSSFTLASCSLPAKVVMTQQFLTQMLERTRLLNSQYLRESRGRGFYTLLRGRHVCTTLSLLGRADKVVECAERRYSQSARFLTTNRGTPIPPIAHARFDQATRYRSQVSLLQFIADVKLMYMR